MVKTRIQLSDLFVCRLGAVHLQAHEARELRERLDLHDLVDGGLGWDGVVGVV